MAYTTRERVRLTGTLRGQGHEANCAIWATKVSLGQIDSIYTAPSIENVSEPLPDGEYQLFANGALVATVRRVKGEGWLDRHTLKTGARRTTHPRLHRMLSEKGNPSMDNLDAILRAVREQPRVNLEAHAVKAA